MQKEEFSHCIILLVFEHFYRLSVKCQQNSFKNASDRQTDRHILVPHKGNDNRSETRSDGKVVFDRISLLISCQRKD
jgi:hypothetical protein